jgi:hypothetical protein
MYQLSVKNNARFTAKNESDMLKGSMFEFWATGGTSSPIAEELCKDFENNKTVKKFQKETIDKVYRAALSAKRAFIETDYANAELCIPIKNGYDLVFHPDVIGTIKVDKNPPFAAIVDTKYTASINEVWNTKMSKIDFLQAITYIAGFYEYSRIHLEKAIHLPFVYQITEHNDFSKVLHKYIMITATTSDIAEFFALLDKVIADKTFAPKAHDYNCLGKGNANGKCRYLDMCDEGRALINRMEVIEYGKLQ